MPPTHDRFDMTKTLGWREWVRLPDLGIKRIKAKIDTGALSSCLHANDIEVHENADLTTVSFKLQPVQKDHSKVVEATAAVHEFRQVRSSNGQTTTRPVIRTTIEIMSIRYEIDVTLFDRAKMGFRMLIGRAALRGRFVVDPEKSYCGGKPKKKTKRKGQQ